jgi:hypothetical protein
MTRDEMVKAACESQFFHSRDSDLCFDEVTDAISHAIDLARAEAVRVASEGAEYSWGLACRCKDDLMQAEIHKHGHLVASLIATAIDSALGGDRD